MKKILFIIATSLSLSSCLDHLLESDKTETSKEVVNQDKTGEAKETRKSNESFEKNSPGRFPVASQRLLTLSELQSNKYSASDLSIMRNEIFARHGYKFNSGGEMDQYFRKQNWYKAKHSDVSSLLSPLEKQNIDLIKKASDVINGSSEVLQDNIPQLEDEAGGYGNIMVENLRLRDKPSLDGETIVLLKKDSFVNVDEQTTFKTTIELNGEEVTDVWFKIVSEDGKVGWVHGCCIDVTWP